MVFSVRAVYYFDGNERPWTKDEITVFVDNGPFLPDHSYEASTDDDGVAVFDIEDRSTKLGLGLLR